VGGIDRAAARIPLWVAAILRVVKFLGGCAQEKPPLIGRLERNSKSSKRFLTQGDVTGDCQNQKALLVERKRKPDFVIKLLH
jgi:hypothetical protein